MTSLSKAHVGNRASPHVAGHDDVRFFSHPGSGPGGEHGSSEPSSSVRKLAGGPALERDSKGSVAFSEGLTAGSHRVADRIRAATQCGRGAPEGCHDLSIASERHEYTD
jgi:hypothetical protein